MELDRRRRLTITWQIMIVLHPAQAAHQAVRARPDRPATAVIHDSADARMLVFHLAPGQRVEPHRNSSTVQLIVLDGAGFVSGEDDGKPTEQACIAGEVIVYAPNELHGMRADEQELVILATITPRPGSR
jgi:quercetin dioxygenase-like cupin family protein